jgi:small acid-soluble spore protein P (minor)
MSKPKTQPVQNPEEVDHKRRPSKNHQPNEPLSGSKSVKNRNHTRHNNAEG